LLKSDNIFEDFEEFDSASKFTGGGSQNWQKKLDIILDYLNFFGDFTSFADEILV
jgi:hypothetical protein